MTMVAFADTETHVCISICTSVSAYPRLTNAMLSTKYFDDETDLVYYGYRYYRPEMGRFISADPAGELAFLLNTVRQQGIQHSSVFLSGNQASRLLLRDATERYLAPATKVKYLFVENAPSVHIDILGLDVWCGFDTFWDCQPCNDGDGYGHQQAADKFTDGCSAPLGLGDNPSGLPGCSFLSACDAHDCCYGTCGASKLNCDVSFANAMKSICTTCAGGSFWLQVVCDSWANTYYLAVLFGGGTPFDNNQRTYCDPCICCELEPIWPP